MSFDFHYVLPPTGTADYQPIREMFDDLKAYVNTLIPSGSAAPINAQYVTLTTNATLTAERVLTAGTGINLTDNGAGSTVVLANTGVLSIATTNVNTSFGGTTGNLTFTFSPTPTFSSLTFQSATGAIGITPSASAFASYNLTLPLNTGSSGYVLTTDGATPTATLVWASTGVKAITGTTNQISVDSSGDPIVISAAQDIGTSSSPTFSQVKLTGGTSGSDVSLKFDDDNNGFWGGTGLSTKLYVAGNLVTTWSSAGLLDQGGVVRTTNLQLKNGSGNILTMTPNSSFSDYTLTWPADDGTPNQFLQTNGSGVLVWADFSSLGATKALDNLASVAINTSLLPGSSSSIDLGSTSKKWLNIYTTGAVSIAGNLSFTETGGGTDTITIEAPSVVTVAYALKLPGTQGGSNTFLKNDGSGNLSWSSTTAAGAATTALDNLASVAINTSLLPGSDNSIDLGGTSFNLRSLYLSTSIKNGSTVLATATQLGYLSTTTSDIQTQLGTKAPLASPTFTGTVTTPNIAITDTTNQLVIGTTRTVTLTVPTPATSSRTVTLPDLVGNYSIVGTIGTQTISGTKTFDGQLIAKGTATNDSASSGYIGEILSSAVTNVTPTNGQYVDVTSLVLTAGDWDVSINGEISANGGNVTGTQYLIGIGTGSGNNGAGLVSGDNSAQLPTSPTTASDVSMSVPAYRISVGTSSTYYFKYFAAFTVNTPKISGRMSARRVR